ncbi:MAG: hypothetical protein JSS74_03740 [Actinobacteria bacterium]|nr:hypothetical protein [Actinomycetota bacterium]
MSDLGQPRKAQHKASAFAGLLKPVAELAPETVPDPAPEQVPAEPVAIVEPSSKPADVAPSTTTTKSKRRAKSTTAPRVPEPTSTLTPAEETTSDGERDLVNQPVNVTLRESLMNKLNAYKEETGLSHPIILFTAIETHIDELPDRLRRSVAGATAPEGGRSLFDMPRVVAHKTDGERTETFIIRVNKKNKAILDGLWKELGAPSRNALFVAAYEAFLSTK